LVWDDDAVTAVRLAHTYELDTQTLATIRRLCADAFGRGFPGNFDDDDWDHALGGVHAIATDGKEIVAHASVVQRRMLHGDRALRAGYVEAVAVRPDRQRRGLGAAVMHALAPVVRGAYEIGVLAAGPDAGRLYMSLGWQPWRGATWVLTPAGIERTPDDDDSTYVMALGATLDLSGDLVCDWRDGDVW
jgi:aminoglycoside 2'-N-acetyltransferase I